ncbi:MAG: sigma-70 family RNA polymerase sigma factor [Okeania sp. SIO3B5]|uniref:sigma-70 family RNA polymerase sigma factor n=1 Tax=Okeania sp. SIO3B5 TaxID=2607811 RepID=UPI00140198FE|nr:sigma-70 family RNA polymerase sigma factor [Okeania sp. SIO3B5]NEO57980.1 sigma-70 family RNA polymerase sigma factor [Okeania sp. SIO3B5]
MIFNRNRDIKAKFSTFFNIEEKSNKLGIINFQTVPKLAKNFDGIFQSYPEVNEEYCAKFFVKEVQTKNKNKLEKEHLSAYLEESCYWLATQELNQQLAPIKWQELDCFQEARKIAAEPSKIFAKYNFTDTSVITWAKRQIKHQVRQIAYVGKEFCKYATWSAPKYLSEKMLIEALQTKSNINTKKEIDSCTLAFKSYKAVYRSKPEKIGGKLAEPSKKQWEDIKNYYNKLCSRYNNKLSSDNSEPLEEITDFQQIKDTIIACEKVARGYCCTLEYVEKNSTLEKMISVNYPPQETESEEQKQIISVCLSEFSKLTPECQKLMQLYYGLNISQTEMSEIFGMHQSQICRKIKEREKKLLIALEKWCQANLEITPNEGIIEERRQFLKDWLKYYFQQQFYRVLQENLLGQKKEKIMILRLHYGERLKLDTVAEKLKVSEQKVAGEIEMVQQKLQIFLQQWIMEKMEICLPKSANKRIANFVEEWLKIAPYAMWN